MQDLWSFVELKGVTDAIYFKPLHFTISSCLSPVHCLIKCICRKAAHLHLKTLTKGIPHHVLLQSDRYSVFLTCEFCIFPKYSLSKIFFAIANGPWKHFPKISLKKTNINVSTVFQCFVNVMNTW